MNDLININHQLGKQIRLYSMKLAIAIEGLEAIISDGSDNLKIAEKTLEAMQDCDKQFPQEQSEKEQGAVQVGLYCGLGVDGSQVI